MQLPSAFTTASNLLWAFSLHARTVSASMSSQAVTRLHLRLSKFLWGFWYAFLANIPHMAKSMTFKSGKDGGQKSIFCDFFEFSSELNGTTQVSSQFKADHSLVYFLLSLSLWICYLIPHWTLVILAIPESLIFFTILEYGKPFCQCAIMASFKAWLWWCVGILQRLCASYWTFYKPKYGL